MKTPATFVPPKGVIETAKYIIVGEQPGKTEVKMRQPFIGPAGRELDDNMRIVNILKHECYFTNVIKDLDFPINNYISFKSNGEPVISKRGEEYIDMLEQELRSSTGIIVAVGNIALFALTSRRGITKWRGSIVESTLLPDRYVIPCIHPATVIPPKFQYLNRLLIQFDLKKAYEYVNEGYNPKPRNFITGPSFSQCNEFLENCITEGLNGTVIDYDLEVHNEEVSCISFSYNSHTAISIPFINSSGDYFIINDELFIWRKIARILEDPKIRKRGQNICFDAHFLLNKFGIKSVNLDDTMIAQKILMPDYPVGLDFITSIWTDMPYYKDDGKKFFKTGGRWETLWQYNARDSIVCSEAFPKQLKELEKQGNLETYERQRRLIEPLVYMMQRGIRVDVDAMAKAYEEKGHEVVRLKSELNKMAGFELNANSHKQIKEYFYETKKQKPYMSKGKITVDETALKRLSRKGFSEASKILEIRRAVKNRSTYLDVGKVDKDGRMRCSFNPVGTRYSRISSSSNIFGTGTNLQNQPHSVLRFYLADEGYVYYSFDLSMAENRIVAYFGRVCQMIEAFENGLDVHKTTAALIFGVPYDEVTTEDGSCPIGDGTHSQRFFGKKANHGLNYDLGYRKFALSLEIPENDAKLIVERYHKAYPGVRNGFHAEVRKQLQKNRTLTNLMGRRTLFLDRWGDSLFKEAYSCIPQGTVGDIINERGVEFTYYDDKFRHIELLTQVHDSVGFQIPLPTDENGITWLDHAEWLNDIKNSLETPLEVHSREIILPADLTIGFNMGEVKELKGKNFPSDLNELANQLKTIVEGLNGAES